MKLMTKAILKRIPNLYEQDGKGKDATVHVKFFCPWGSYTWYATEFDPEEGRFFGYVTSSQGAEFGYFMLEELESLRGPFGLKIERDRHFGTPTLREALGE
jgi:hypothetical protein